MAGVPDVGMERGDLKRLLNVAKGEAVNCAIGLGKDNTGLVMMHKTKNPKAVEKDLSTKFGDMKASRWGTVLVDEEGTVKFTINKAVSGMARRLTKSLKGTGFNKVELLLEDGSSVENASDDEEAEGGEAPPKDLGAIQKDLVALVGQIGKADPGKAAALKGMAAEAATALKAQDGAKAEEAIGRLKQALEAPAAAPGKAEPKAAGAPVSFVAMQKSRLLWDGARKKVAGEIAALRKEALDMFEDDPEESMVVDALDQLDEITGTLDERLLNALDDLLNEQDPAKHAELLEDAKEVLGDYADFVKSNELVQKLNGDTPFGIKLSIGPTYLSVIKALQANLH